MRNTFLLLILLLALQGAYAQSKATAQKGTNDLKLKVTYTLRFQPDSTDGKKVQTEKMLLFVGSNFSKFQSLNRYLIDSLVTDIESKGGIKHLGKVGFNASALPKSDFKFEIYKNYPKGAITVIDKVEVSDYMYTEPLRQFKWHMTKEKAVVAGYACQKATTTYEGRNYVAWFTNELPISEGPYKFSGLPGLIIKISDTQNHYSFELTSLKHPTTSQNIQFSNKKLISTTKKDLAKGQKDFNENMAARLSGIVSVSDPEALRMAEQNAKKKNNPIELAR